LIRYCLGFAFTPNFQNVVLLTKARPDWQAGKLNGVGGKVEDDETHGSAMNREWFEETGVPLTSPWTRVVKMHDSEWVVDVFTTHILNEAALQAVHNTKERDEPVSIHRVNNLPSHSLDNLHWLISMCIHPPQGYNIQNYDT